MKYIDADKLIAEIKRYKNEADERLEIRVRTCAEELKDLALQNLCDNLLNFIDSLQQEQSEGNLEKEIQRYLCEECSSDDEPTIVEIARHFYELGKLNMRKDVISNNKSSLLSNLDEVAEEYANKEYPDEPCVGRWGTGDYEPPVDREYDREIAKDAFKEGVKVIINQRVSLGYLISWYIQSVDAHPPIWTEEHLMELDKDFILIPKPLNNP